MVASGAGGGPGMSRRGFLAAAAASALGLPAVLAACGSDHTPVLPAPAGTGSAAWWARQQLSYRVNFANWQFYIDVLKGRHPSLQRFTQQSHITVSYTE